MEFKDIVDQKLQEKGYQSLDYTLNELKLMALKNKEKINEKTETHTIVKNSHQPYNVYGSYDNIQCNTAIGQVEGRELTFEKHFINTYISNDLEISITLPTSGATGSNNRRSYQRFDNDLNIWSISVESRNNKQIFNYSKQEGLIFAPLLTQIYSKQNLNLQGHFVEQKIYPLGAHDKESANGGSTIASKLSFKLSEVFGGINSFFSQYMYITDDVITWKIRFTPTYFRILINGANDVFSEDAAWTPAIHTANQAGEAGNVADDAVGNNYQQKVQIKQTLYQLPGTLRSLLGSVNYYLKYDYIQRIFPTDVISMDLLDRHLQFNLAISQAQFGHQLKGVFVVHMQHDMPLATTHGTFQAESSGVSYEKIVPRNLLYLAEIIQIKNGTQELWNDLNNSDVIGTFMDKLGNMNIPQDLSKCCIFLGPEKLTQYSNNGILYLNFNIKMRTNDLPAQATYTTEDFYCYVLGQNSLCVKQGQIKQSEIEL